MLFGKLIKSWLTASSVRRRLSGQMKFLERLWQECRDSRAAVEALGAELRAIADRVEQELDDARRLHVRYESALEEVREKNRVLEQTIQTLVASHRLLLERYDAETAIQVRLKTAASVRE